MYLALVRYSEINPIYSFALKGTSINQSGHSSANPGIIHSSKHILPDNAIKLKILKAFGEGMGVSNVLKVEFKDPRRFNRPFPILCA